MRTVRLDIHCFVWIGLLDSRTQPGDVYIHSDVEHLGVASSVPQNETAGASGFALDNDLGGRSGESIDYRGIARKNSRNWGLQINNHGFSNKHMQGLAFGLSYRRYGGKEEQSIQAESYTPKLS